MDKSKEVEGPNCYKCKHRRSCYGDAHSSCVNKAAEVEGDKYGKSQGWFAWPYNFDPVWLKSCTGFEAKKGGS